MDSKLVEIDKHYLIEIIKSITYGRVKDETRSIEIARFIVLSESMGVITHGVKYFIRSIFPFLDEHIASVDSFENSFIYENKSIEGIYYTKQVIKKASQLASKTGYSLSLIKNPGKVGALRAYCPEITKSGQTIVILKNTASSISYNGERIVGTNPLCIGIANSNFIFDSSTSTVATNKLRIFKDRNKVFESNVGLDKQGNHTNDPSEILDYGSLLPFSDGAFFYKSFFLGVAIELLSVMAGGKSGMRVGNPFLDRFYSKEGMVILIIDSNHLSDLNEFNNEVENYILNLKALGAHIPGSYNDDATVQIESEDYEWLIKSHSQI